MSMRPGQAKGPSVGTGGGGGGGGGNVTGSFTVGTLPVGAGLHVLSDSIFSQASGVGLVTGDFKVTGLAGVSSRMVVVDADGLMSTQAIPTGSVANPTATIGLTAINGSASSSIRSDGAPALSQAIVPTWTGVHTFSAQPILSSLTASLPVFTDASKGLVSNAMTGTGSVVMSASPTLTGTISAASMTLSGTLGVTGAITASNLTASQAVFTDGSKALVSNAITGTGNVVMSASPTLTGTVSGAALTLSGTLTLSALTASLPVFTDASKGLVSNAMTGTGSVVMSVSPTLTGTITAASMTLSGTFGVTGAITASNLTASQAVFTDGSKALVSNAITGTGNVVMSASPTLTGTISGAALTLSGTLTLSALTASLPVFTDATKGLVSNAMTGTGSVVMSASPTLTGTLTAAIAAFSGAVTMTSSLGVSGQITNNQLTGSTTRVVTATSAGVLGASSNATISGVNTWAEAQTFTASATFNATGSGTSSALVLSAAAPTLTVVVSGAGADEKVWDITGGATSLDFRTRTDAYGTGASWMTVARSGTTVSSITLPLLAGSGTRMVVADANGAISTQSIPAGASLANPTGTIGLSAVNGVLTSGMRSDGAPALSQAIVPTWTGVHTFSAQPILSTLTASQAVFTDGSKGLVSNAITGSGNVVMSASPTLTGTVTAAAVSLSGNLSIADATGVVTTISASTRTLIARSSTTLNVGENGGWTALNASIASGTVSFKIGGTDYLTITSSAITAASLAGSGTRMVVADASGALSTQSIPAGGSLANPTGTIGLTAVNGVLTTGMRSDGAPALSQAIVPTWTGVHTFSAQPILSTLTASQAVFTDGSKGLVSNAITGTGNVVMSASPTLTGTLTAASATFSGTVSTVGRASIGNTGSTDGWLYVTGTAALVGVNNYGVVVAPEFQSNATSNGGAIYVAFKTAASSFTMAVGTGVSVQSPTIGAGSTVTTVYGIKVEDQTGAGTNYALYTGAGLVRFGGVATFASQPILSSLTASQAVFTDGSKGLVSNAITGTGNVVMSASPTLTGTITAAILTASGKVTAADIRITSFTTQYTIPFATNTSGDLGASTSLTFNSATSTFGTANITASGTIVFSTLTASQAVFTNGSSQLVSNALTGTGNVVMSASPTLTGTITAAAATFSGTVTLSGTVLASGLTASQAVFTDGSKNLVSNSITGSGNVVMSASPTLTGTITAAAATLSGILTLNASGANASSALTMSSAAPTMLLVATGASADRGKWNIGLSATALEFKVLADDFVTNSTFMSFTRGTGGNAVTVQSMRLNIGDVGSSSLLYVNGSYNVVAASTVSLTSITTASLTVTSALTMSGGILTHLATLSTDVALAQSGGAIATNAALGDDFTISAGGGTGGSDYTMSNPTNAAAGRTIRYRIEWDNGVPTAWGSAFGFVSDTNPSGTIPTSATASHRYLYIAFKYNAVDAKWNCVGQTFTRNF